MSEKMNLKRCLWSRGLENIDQKSSSSSCPTYCNGFLQVKSFFLSQSVSNPLFQISFHRLRRWYTYWSSIYLYNIWYCCEWNWTRHFDWTTQAAWSWNLDGRWAIAQSCYWYRTDWRCFHSGFVLSKNV